MSWGVNSVDGVGYYLGSGSLPSSPAENAVVTDNFEFAPVDQTDSFTATSLPKKKDNFSYIEGFINRAEKSGDTWLLNSQDFLELKNVIVTYSPTFQGQDGSDELKQRINQKLEEKGYLAKAKSFDKALMQEQELQAQQQELQAQQQELQAQQQELQAQKQELQAQNKDERMALAVYSTYTGGASTEEAHEALDPWLKQTGAEVISLSQEQAAKNMEQERAENDQIFKWARTGDTQAQIEATERHANLVVANNDLDSLSTTTQNDATAGLTTDEDTARAEKLEVVGVEAQQNKEAQAKEMGEYSIESTNETLQYGSDAVAMCSANASTDAEQQGCNKMQQSVEGARRENHQNSETMKNFEEKIKNLPQEKRQELIEDKRDDGKLSAENERYVAGLREQAEQETHGTNHLINTRFIIDPDKHKEKYGISIFDDYQQNRERLNLDKVLHESTLRRIRTESSSSSYYYGNRSDEKHSGGGKSESSANAAAPTLSDPLHDKNVSMGLISISDLNQAQQDIAKRHSLDPKTEMPLINMLSSGDTLGSLEYARNHGMTALEANLLNLQESKITKTAPPPSNQSSDAWSAFALNEQDPIPDAFLERPLGQGFRNSHDNFFNVSIS